MLQLQFTSIEIVIKSDNTLLIPFEMRIRAAATVFFCMKMRCDVSSVLALAHVCLRGQYGCWCSHWAEQEHVSPPQCGKTSPCLTGSLVETAVLYEQNQISAVSGRHGGTLFSPIGVWLLSCLCFIESIDHRFSLVSSLFPLASVSCLTLLLIIDTCTDRLTDGQTHKPQKQTESRHLHSQHRVEKLMGCSCSRLWLRSCVGKGIMTLNLRRGQTNHTGIFLFPMLPLLALHQLSMDFDESNFTTSS